MNCIDHSMSQICKQDNQIVKMTHYFTKETCPVCKLIKLQEALSWTLEYIDAIPKEVVLPTMPGFDRDYVNSLLER